MLARQLQRVERRVDHAHVAALRLHAQQVLGAAGHAQHVAIGHEDDIGSQCQGNRLVDDLDRRDADRAARSVDERDLLRQHPVDAVLEEAVRLAPADFHDAPRPRDGARYGVEELAGGVTVAVLVEVAHYGPPSVRSMSKTFPASPASILLSAKPTWTMT